MSSIVFMMHKNPRVMYKRTFKQGIKGSEIFWEYLRLQLHDKLISKLPLQYEKMFLRTFFQTPTNPTTNVKERWLPELSRYAPSNFKRNVKLSSVGLIKLQNSCYQASHFASDQVQASKAQFLLTYIQTEKQITVKWRSQSRNSEEAF